MYRYMSSVKSWIYGLRCGEDEPWDDNTWTRVRPETGVRQILRHIQSKSRGVMNICDSLQRLVVMTIS